MNQSQATDWKKTQPQTGPRETNKSPRGTSQQNVTENTHKLKIHMQELGQIIPNRGEEQEKNTRAQRVVT
jgi:hypothetical protein